MKRLTHYLLILALTVGIFFQTAFSVSAQITNTGLPGPLGSDAQAAASGESFTNYFVSLWRSIIVIGGLLVLFYFIWGAIEWITAGGDTGKVDKARNRLTQSVIGLIILVASFTFIGFISSTLFGEQFNILNPVIPTPAGVTNSLRNNAGSGIKSGGSTTGPSTGNKN